MIGLAYKAKKVISGESLVRNSIRNGKVKAVIITEDASLNTRKRFSHSAHYYDVPYYLYFNKDELSTSIGGKMRSVIGIIDQGFATEIQKLIDNTL